jgi:hypothetical protein
LNFSKISRRLRQGLKNQAQVTSQMQRKEETLDHNMTQTFVRSRRFILTRDVSLQFVTLSLLALLASCGPPNPPTSVQLDEQLMNVTTSPIPGAQAKVLPAPPGTSATGQPANFCVTDAGYCPLSAATPAGQNCLCTAGNLAYGGQTGMAPKTIPYTPPIKFLGAQAP